MNTLAKRIYNIAPESIEATFADGSKELFEMRSAEFFQEEFQGVAARADDDREYRIITTGPDNERVLVGREREDGGFEQVGEIIEVEPTE